MSVIEKWIRQKINEEKVLGGDIDVSNNIVKGAQIINNEHVITFTKFPSNYFLNVRLWFNTVETEGDIVLHAAGGSPHSGNVNVMEEQDKAYVPINLFIGNNSYSIKSDNFVNTFEWLDGTNQLRFDESNSRTPDRFDSWSHIEVVDCFPFPYVIVLLALQSAHNNESGELESVDSYADTLIRYIQILNDDKHPVTFRDMLGIDNLYWELDEVYNSATLTSLETEFIDDYNDYFDLLLLDENDQETARMLELWDALKGPNVEDDNFTIDKAWQAFYTIKDDYYTDYEGVIPDDVAEYYDTFLDIIGPEPEEDNDVPSLTPIVENGGK